MPIIPEKYLDLLNAKKAFAHIADSDERRLAAGNAGMVRLHQRQNPREYGARPREVAHVA